MTDFTFLLKILRINFHFFTVIFLSVYIVSLLFIVLKSALKNWFLLSLSLYFILYNLAYNTAMQFKQWKHNHKWSFYCDLRCRQRSFPADCVLSLSSSLTELYWISPIGAILQSIRILFPLWKHHSEPILCLHVCNVPSLPACLERSSIPSSVHPHHPFISLLQLGRRPHPQRARNHDLMFI